MAKIGSMTIDDKEMREALAAGADTGYIGVGDALLHFGKADSFCDEGKSQKNFGIKLVNKGTKTIYVQFNELISGLEKDFNVLAEGTVATDLTVTGNPNSASMLAAFLKANATRVNSIKFKVDDADQLDEPIKLVKVDVFGSKTYEQFIPSDEQSQDTNNPKMSEITDIVDWVCSDKSTLLYGIRAGRSVNLSITFGASVDNAHYVSEKAAQARKTVAIGYLKKTQQA